MEGTTRIHIGAGHYYWPGFVNIDLVGRADIKSDIMSLPYSDGDVDEIHAIHIFEHISRLQVDSALNEWNRILKIGGKLVMEMPSLDKIAKMITEGEENIRLTLLGIFGDPRDPSPYMKHQWAWTDKELRDVLQYAGFDVLFEKPVFHLEKRDLRVIGGKK